MKFQNPTNGYIEEVPGAAWLWTLLFGSLYFAVRGVWGHAVVSLVLAFCTFGLSWLIYPFLAQGILEKQYLRKGWIRVPDKRYVTDSFEKGTG